MGKGGESIPDEEWERFLREAETGSGSAPKEPSARARMVARRLREEPAPPPWRSYQAPPPRRRTRTAWYVGGLVLAIALLVVALAPGRMAEWFGVGGGSGDGTPLAAESQRPDGPPPTEPASRRPTLDEPFRGSPAARWADGAAGITVPEARATGWMSKGEVAKALKKTRDFLVASSLDPDVLRGERPREAIAMLNPHQKDVQDFVTAAFRAPSRENDPLLLFSRFEGSKVRLVGDVVKARGRITFEEGERGAVEVTTDVTYVYPVAPAAGGGDEVVRTIVRREVVMSWDDPEKVVIDPGTFSLVSYKVDSTNGGCDTFTGYLTPPFGAERAGSPPRDGAVVDPYDRSTSMDARMREGDDAGCATATRS
ncbi:hypothetical protein [Streptomyces sp. bgisy022]|uniref:hypothetical protein n=1 Tax=Streptomyces sp. bgisy022 TaxID=3413769 RepID=UPI003D70BDB3